MFPLQYGSEDAHSRFAKLATGRVRPKADFWSAAHPKRIRKRLDGNSPALQRWVNGLCVCGKSRQGRQNVSFVLPDSLVSLSETPALKRWAIFIVPFFRGVAKAMELSNPKRRGYGTPKALCAKSKHTSCFGKLKPPATQARVLVCVIREIRRERIPVVVFVLEQYEVVSLRNRLTNLAECSAGEKRCRQWSILRQ